MRPFPMVLLLAFPSVVACQADAPSSEGPGEDAYVLVGDAPGFPTEDVPVAGDGDPVVPDEGPGDAAVVVEGVACVDTPDPAAFPGCCESEVSRCIPDDLVAPIFSAILAPCGQDGLCVPPDVAASDGSYTPAPCTSIAGSEGGCLSACAPGVASYVSLLPQDVCPDAEVCAPCINPLDGEPTGICQTFSCAEDALPDPDPDPEPEPDPFSCENMPEEPVVDMSLFAACCDGAHCIPSELLPPELADALEPCPDGVSACIPDLFVETAGFFVPETCTLPGDLEGRCLSTCLPFIADNLDALPQATCPDTERCAPCCDPFTGEDTGACSAGCDTGPAGGVCTVAYATCCLDKGEGHCIPSELIPTDLQESLDKDTCDASFLCVPDVFQDPDHVPATCTVQIPPFIGDTFDGVCMPKCLKLPLDELIWSGTCSSVEDCVPCSDPLTGEPTGAPGCPPA